MNPATRGGKPPPRRTLLMAHEALGGTRHGGYLVSAMRPIWESWGCRILDVDSPHHWPGADAVFVHVDLTFVPSGYAKEATRYATTLNARADSIAKRTCTSGVIRSGDGYEGPVMVKTNLNHAGIPEVRQWNRQHPPARWPRLTNRWPFRKNAADPPPPSLSKESYTVFASPRLVPPGIYDNPEWVVQRFCTERYGDEFVLREYYFLGEAECLRTEIGREPIFTSGRLIHHAAGPIHGELRSLRQKLGLDYGKIDYVMEDGKPFIFDVNKTIGADTPPTKASKELASLLAWGLFPKWEMFRHGGAPSANARSQESFEE
ncbi:MAG: hypothetical protein SFU85_07675 [Candidatus Methylacidiphilales bacterium]|nr:hypothetical protein [Candidatus Methylacidiphilales bacterium]